MMVSPAAEADPRISYAYTATPSTTAPASTVYANPVYTSNAERHVPTAAQVYYTNAHPQQQQWTTAYTPQYAPQGQGSFYSSSPSTSSSQQSPNEVSPMKVPVGPTTTVQPVQPQWYQGDCSGNGVIQSAQSAYYYPESYYYQAQYYPSNTCQVQPVDTKNLPMDKPRSASASSESSSKTSSEHEKLEDHPMPSSINPFQSYAEALSAAYGVGADAMPAIILPQAYPLSALSMPQMPPSLFYDGSIFGDVLNSANGGLTDSELSMKIPGMTAAAAAAYPHAAFLHAAAAAAAAAGRYGMLEPRPLVESKPSTNKKKRKDPNAPKNPLSAYLFFVTEQRSQLAQQAHSGKSSDEGAPGNSQAPSFSAVAKELGQRWKTMTDEEKQPYVDMAKKDKQRYEAEKLAFKGKKVFIS
jgi:hypothetical protein